MASLEQHAQRLRANPAALRAMQERLQGASQQWQQQQQQPAQQRGGQQAADSSQAHVRGASIHDHAREASFSDWACAPLHTFCRTALK